MLESRNVFPSSRRGCRDGVSRWSPPLSIGFCRFLYVVGVDCSSPILVLTGSPSRTVVGPVLTPPEHLCDWDGKDKEGVERKGRQRVPEDRQREREGRKREERERVGEVKTQLELGKYSHR